MRGFDSNDETRPRRWSAAIWKSYRRSVAVLLVALASINVWGAIEYRQDSAELRRIADRVVGDATTPSEQMRRLASFMYSDVEKDRPESYFLLPIFKPLKPTAMQVIREGGDCSYKARALTVLARHRGIDASKWALYDDEGVPVHAVAVVETERGDYVVDLKYGIIHEDAAGKPIPFEQLRDDPNRVQQSLAFAAANGYPQAARYSIERYPLKWPRSFNWEHLAVTQWLYNGLSFAFGSRWVDTLPMPHMVNEPFWLVVFVSSLVSVLAISPLALRTLWRSRVRKMAVRSRARTTEAL